MGIGIIHHMKSQPLVPQTNATIKAICNEVYAKHNALQAKITAKITDTIAHFCCDEINELNPVLSKPSKVRIIQLLAEDEDGFRARMMNSGIQDWAMKTFTHEELAFLLATRVTMKSMRAFEDAMVELSATLPKFN